MDPEVFLIFHTCFMQCPSHPSRPNHSNNVCEEYTLKAVTLTFVAEGMHFVPGSRSSVRYSIYSGDPDGYFNIDPVAGTIRTASALDHEAHQSVLLNVQAMSGDPPTYGHTQVSG